MEQADYRSRGTPAERDHAADGYLVWPPWSAEPITRAQLVAQFKQQSHRRSRIDLAFKGCTAKGDALVIYYSTVKHSAEPADRSTMAHDTVHVWISDHGTWTLLGGLTRQR